jgi:hypothetical protein
MQSSLSTAAVAQSGAARHVEIARRNQAESMRVAKFKLDTVARLARWNAKHANKTKSHSPSQGSSADYNAARLRLLRFAGSHAYAESMVEKHGPAWRPTLNTNGGKGRPSTSSSQSGLVSGEDTEFSAMQTKSPRATTRPLSSTSRPNSSGGGVGGSESVRRREMLVDRLVVQMKQQQDKRRQQAIKHTARAVRERLVRSNVPSFLMFCCLFVCLFACMNTLVSVWRRIDTRLPVDKKILTPCWTIHLTNNSCVPYTAIHSGQGNSRKRAAAPDRTTQGE